MTGKQSEETIIANGFGLFVALSQPNCRQKRLQLLFGGLHDSFLFIMFQQPTFIT